MKFQKKKLNNTLVFSKWTRKSYAIFASFNKIVKIARLSFDISISSFNQIQSILRTINKNINGDSNNISINENEFLNSECLLEQLIALGVITIDKSNLSRYILTNQSPYFTYCRIWILFLYKSYDRNL